MAHLLADEDPIIDADFDAAASYYSAVAFGTDKKTTIQRMKDLYKNSDHLDPLVYITSKHRIDYTPPFNPTEEMWGGLARSIMMWLDMTPSTPRTLFKHLESSGIDIPEWLKSELEMTSLDHIPSKGTRCVLIYKAMMEDFYKSKQKDDKDELNTGNSITTG